MRTPHRPIHLRLGALFAILFGALTLKSGGAVLFIDGAARSAAGNYVPFVLWFNFIAGFFYIIGGIGMWLLRRWSLYLAGALALATLLIFAALGLHILLQGSYELRTVFAMTLRSTVWITLTTLLWLHWRRLDELEATTL